MYRSHTCGELRMENTGTEVTLAGWVQTSRAFGAITFVDLRDRYGITQLYFNEAIAPQLAQAGIGRETVLQATGRVIERHNKTDKIPTGAIEVEITGFQVLNHSAVPPFTIEEESDGGEDLRMKYRYLDLRRPPLKRNLELRYRISRTVRNFLDRNGFMEIETPFLIKSTPEGARDFVVPSRMNEGQFYALPQSPQTFKQLLMVSGYDRYFQIVKCFRDEDLRADRQPEFTQIDCEMSFVEQEDILQTFESLFKEVLSEVRGISLEEALPRMTWEEAMRDYGNDKPDLRFGMKLRNLKVRGEYEAMVLSAEQFPVFQQAETIIGIVVKGGALWSRKQTDAWTEWVKRPQVGLQGLVTVRCLENDSFKSSVDKFFTQHELSELAASCGAVENDLILIVAGTETQARKAASALRLALAEELGMRDNSVFKPLWVVDFPLFEYDEDAERFVARHHPFTAPKPEHIEWMNDLSKYHDIKANAYDLVLNGTEIGGGSIRIFQRDLQEKMFAALGMDAHEQQEKFGFLLGAFEFGAPPHGGIALGFDRLCALLGGQETIRDFIAFPKNNSGRDVMLDAPSAIDETQLQELGISLQPSQE